MSLFINLIFRQIIVCSAPVLLGVEEPLDFIKDCLALFFITKLDDLDDAILFEKELEKVRGESSYADMGALIYEEGSQDEKDPPATEVVFATQADLNETKQSLEELWKQITDLKKAAQ
eukprot:CAMPEP_0179085796 /NCGR_PEP_ID=MMETSP0796-20121207/38877_1 /TAXON_ID=73915 /ORGANISM="Pyrodinium bahamense, Strain pbaha01" /LENGTH=117 /DNA_ID=CAMNT_0020783243 /DNA_START=199 /DNA_END=552 /DNA_ORIENTATION=-